MPSSRVSGRKAEGMSRETPSIARMFRFAAQLERGNQRIFALLLAGLLVVVNELFRVPVGIPGVFKRLL
jgi:hypothetical protein